MSEKAQAASCLPPPQTRITLQQKWFSIHTSAEVKHSNPQAQQNSFLLHYFVEVQKSSPQGVFGELH
ncbi:hypothetical protein F8M41_019673 [Gigaspora margarita]|uniref:Uncharacterized protein n=1 Tax=Gigaspora margarita TaxID=4874 RepID=A0A8H4AJL2_GIGMA|nr:hypothetical protein F8M41_019673 [Gigaspora margarita]